MPIKEIKVVNFRAFEDTGILSVNSPLVIIGANDVGKSGLLYALKWFFEPPKKGGLPLNEIHKKNPASEVQIEVAFDPNGLTAKSIKLDAKNTVVLAAENLLDQKGLLRLRLTLTVDAVKSIEVKIYDLNDPELFGMAALKKHEDLLQLLKDRGLPAVAAGKETNEEKRSALRKHCQSQGIGLKEDWIVLGDKEKAFREILPQFRLFSDEARFGIDETAVQTQFKTVVDRALKQLAIAKEIKTNADKVLQAEFDKVYQNLARLTTTVKAVKAESNVDWKKAVSAISLTWVDQYDVEVPYELRGAGVRRLFMVAYFQYEAAASLHDDKGPKYVFAIEEPEVHLHPGAQRILINALQQLVSLGHTVAFTSHSPVFASIVRADSLVLINRGGASAKSEQCPQIDLSDVARDLGVEAPDRLIGKNHVILVEGMSDAEFFEEALTLLNKKGVTTLDPAKICFLQCGGIGNLKYMAATKRMDEVGLAWGVIADSDRPKAGAPLKPWFQNLSSNPPASCKNFHVLERTTLENYFDAAAIKSVLGLDVNVPSYGKLLSIAGVPLLKADVDNIKQKARDICHVMGADNVLRCSLPAGITDINQSEILLMFQNIQHTFGL